MNTLLDCVIEVGEDEDISSITDKILLINQAYNVTYDSKSIPQTISFRIPKNKVNLIKKFAKHIKIEE